MNKMNFEFPLLVLVTSASLVAGIFGNPTANRTPALLPVADSSPAASPVSGTSGQDLEVEVITLTESGFEPTLITRPRGPFILALHNRSGEKELVFRISRAQAEQVHEVRVRSGRRSQYQRLDLPPGSYSISEAGHPAWSCTLTITR